MNEAFVLDASGPFAWVLPSQASAHADRLLTRIESGTSPVVPTLWFLEVANGLLAAQRRKLLTGDDRRRAEPLLHPDFNEMKATCRQTESWLATSRTNPAPTILFVDNWFEELMERVPVP